MLNSTSVNLDHVDIGPRLAEALSTADNVSFRELDRLAGLNSQTTDRLLVASTLLLRMLDCGKLRLPAVAALHVLMMVPVTLKVVVANVVVMVLQAVEVVPST